MDTVLDYKISDDFLIGALTIDGTKSLFTVKLSELQAISLKSDGYHNPSFRVTIHLKGDGIGIYPLSKPDSEQLYNDIIERLLDE